MNDLSWRKHYRKIWKNPRVNMHGWYIVWGWLLDHATHNGWDVMWKGQRLTLKPGQLTCGRVQIANATGINDSQVRKILNTLKCDNQITIESTSVCSLISITNWEYYQAKCQPKCQPNASEVPAECQPSTTKQEGKEGKNYKKKTDIVELALDVAQVNGSKFVNQARILIAFLNETAGRRYGETNSHLKPIICRLKEVNGDVEGIKMMITRQVKRWGTDEKMMEYLRPKTLFNATNFHEYYANRELPVPSPTNSTNPARISRNAGTCNETDGSEYEGIGRVKS